MAMLGCLGLSLVARGDQLFCCQSLDPKSLHMCVFWDTKAFYLYFPEGERYVSSTHPHGWASRHQLIVIAPVQGRYQPWNLKSHQP